MRRLTILAAITLAHAALTIALVIYVFGDGMARFDTPGPSPMAVRVADGVVTVLSVPLLPAITRLPLSLQPRGFPGEHLIFLANGLVWALAITALPGWYHRRVSGGGPPRGD